MEITRIDGKAKTWIPEEKVGKRKKMRKEKERERERSIHH